jgi:hypothetical protein
MAGHVGRTDPDLWRPLITSFTQFQGLGQRVDHSTLAHMPASGYLSWLTDAAVARPPKPTFTRER